MTLRGERVATPGSELIAQRTPATGTSGSSGTTETSGTSGPPDPSGTRGAPGPSGATTTTSGGPDFSGMSAMSGGMSLESECPDGRYGRGSRFEVASEEDLLTVRHAVRAATVEAGFGLVDQTRIVTAASELARNAYVHGGGGALEIQVLTRSGRKGLRLTVQDDGPGIADVETALIDGYTTGTGLGHGLGGARRLMHEFQVRSGPGEGTTVVVTRWNDR
ncbi:ATP-binding protein [Streptomyces sp. WAC05374]|uniref:ATP-binding protein n=1 Tax=Streptomyces sp. WAC05374 TaxID=2487420 RepID=UPI0026A20423